MALSQLSKDCAFSEKWQLVTARMVILNSLLALRCATKGKWERKILALCPTWMQHFIKDRCPKSGDMLAVIALIEEVLDPKSADLAVLYAFHGPGVCYFGRCGARRWNQAPGFVERLFERLQGILRKESTHAKARVCVMARRVKLGLLCMLPVWLDRPVRIGAMKTLAIRSMVPNGNDSANPENPAAMPLKIFKQKKPSKYPRRPLSDRPVHAGSLFQQWALKFMQKKVCRVEAAQKKTAVVVPKCKDWRSMPFRDVYVLMQKQILAKTGRHGPLPLYMRRRKALLATWLAGAQRRFDWTSCCRQDTIHLRVFSMYQWCQQLLGPIRKSRAMQQIDFALRKFGLPSRHQTSIGVPRLDLRGPLSSLVRTAIRQVRDRCDSPTADWCARRVSIHATKKPPAWTSLRNSAQAVAKLEWGAWSKRNKWQIQAETNAEDLRKVSLDASIEKIASVAEEDAAVCSSFYKWVANNNMGGVIDVKVSLSTTRLLTASESTFQQEFLDELPGREVWLQEDKDKKANWSCSEKTLHAMVIEHLVAKDGPWEPTDLPPAEARKLLAGCVHAALPPCLRRGPMRTECPLPSLFMNVKGKCFHPSGGKLCCDAGHSCFRKVVNCSKLLFKKSWKVIGRAISAMVIDCGLDKECWSLDDAPKRLRSCWAKSRLFFRMCTRAAS